MKITMKSAKPYKTNEATVGKGLQTLARLAAKGGNSIDLSQGHHELPASKRGRLHPGHTSAYDRLRPAAFLDSMK